ncbi:MAG: hypothetical protein CVV30_11105 [Methanomicrobiales archaeon HGW-Methanomicrobiales-1]|jgi:hypothetical protein|nr:MAG: hypothetical protein CVV30_11105 [Methanomicrobiales archaeon HGW-Methanomicrobiales-1]
MGDPYLSSDESLILSTHNIRIGGVSLDLMLTSRRLILIDNSVTPFKLRTIPLETIITVVAGTDVKGDPIITLSHMDPSGSGAPFPVDFFFTRQKGGSRVTECNEWAAILSRYAAGAREGARSAGTLPYDPVKAIQPRMSATYGIETFSPRKPVMGEYAVHAEPVTAPVLPESPEVEDLPAVTDEPPQRVHAEMAESPILSPVLPPDLEDTGRPDPALNGAEEIILTPAVPEEWAESPAPTAPEVKESDEVLPVHEPAPEPVPVQTVNDSPPEGITEPEKPVTLQPEEKPVRDEPRAITDTERIWAEAARSVISSPSSIPVISSDEPIPVTRPGEKKPEDEPEAAVSIIEEPVAGIKEEPRPESFPVITPKSPPALPTKSHSLLPIAAIVVIILAVLAGAVIISFSPKETAEPSLPVIIPDVTVLPVTTSLPTPVPTDGVWVRIDYPGTFIGEVGNPELMHPVSGTGVRFYKILWSDRAVEASAQKQENSGDTLAIEVYNNGTMIKRGSTRAPMGSVSILIDPTTGRPPGIGSQDIP